MNHEPPDEFAAELLQLAESIAAQSNGDEQVEAFMARSTSTTVRAHGGDVESLTSATSAGVGIRVISDHRQGFAWAGSLEKDVLLDTLQAARENAQFAEPSEFVGLATPDGVEPVLFDGFDRSVEEFPQSEKIALAIALEQKVKAGDARITGVRTSIFSDVVSRFAIASSMGIRGSGRGGWCSMSALALASDGDETYTGGGSTYGFSPRDLDIDEAADDAVLRATRLFGAKPVSSRKVAILLEPKVAATIIGLLGSTLTGDRVAKGRSPFADRVGEQIATKALSLVDDPTDHRSYAADTFDGEGLACRRNALVSDGVLQGFLFDSESARRMKTQSTGSAVRGVSSTPSAGCQALAVAPGQGTFAEILASIDSGVYVQSMTGLHSGVNLISGDVSVGIEGLMIENGEFTQPVREVTIASTLQRMLLDISHVGADIEWLPGGTACPTLVIADVSLSGR